MKMGGANNNSNIFRSNRAFIVIVFLMAVWSAVKAQTPTLTYTGSSTIGNFIQDASAQFEQATFIIDVAPESVGGELAVIEGRTDIAGTAKLPGRDVHVAGIQSTLIGWDAIAVIVHQSNPVQNLTQSQLKNIFTGQIKNWTELGGPDLEIHAYIVDIESATRKVFRSKILAEADYSGCQVISPDADMIRTVQQDVGAIGTISYSFLNSLDNTKSLSVNGQALSLTNSNYPITRPLYLLWRGENQLASDFVAWTNSASGQRLIMKRFIGNREAQTEIIDEPGRLIVYTQTTPFEDGGIYYYPHSGYNILTTDRQHVAHVNNHLSNNDENPTQINLRSGTYIIQTESQPVVERFVTIQTDKLSKLHLTQNNVKQSTIEAPTSLVPDDVSQNKFNFLNPYGDLRFRLEEDIRQNFNRFRVRFRVRAGLSASLSPSVKLDLRLGSSNDPNDPNSTHVNADDGFNQINIVIDRAYLEINPKTFKQFHLWLGKFPHRFTNASLFSENVWDDDIQPEGGAFSFTFNPKGIIRRLRFYNGVYLESQFASNSEKDWLNTSQLTADLIIAKNMKVTIASGLYYHANIKDHLVLSDFIDNNGGNSTYFDDFELEHYARDFHILDNFALWHVSGLTQPLIIKTQYIHNLASKTNQTGYVLGLMYGQLQHKGDWRYHYQYQHIEQDAVFSPFVNDDFLRQTNFSGHTAGIAYSFNDKISLQLWTLIDSSITGMSNGQQRFRLDLNAKL
jgi:phosphate transport system substrate-binding protein